MSVFKRSFWVTIVYRSGNKTSFKAREINCSWKGNDLTNLAWTIGGLRGVLQALRTGSTAAPIYIDLSTIEAVWSGKV